MQNAKSIAVGSFFMVLRQRMAALLLGLAGGLRQVGRLGGIEAITPTRLKRPQQGMALQASAVSTSPWANTLRAAASPLSAAAKPA